MRGLIDDLRYGCSELLAAPRSGSTGAAWLLAGAALGLGLARWVDAPLGSPPVPGRPARAEPARVPASRLLDSEGGTRLRCLAGRAPPALRPSGGRDGCPTAAPPSPCAVPPPRRLES